MNKIIYMNQKKTKRFKIGDLVRISDKTHDDGMPTSRMGHILKDYRAHVHYSNKVPVATGAWEIFMTNGNTLIFHEMFLEHVDATD